MGTMYNMMNKKATELNETNRKQIELYQLQNYLCFYIFYRSIRVCIREHYTERKLGVFTFGDKMDVYVMKSGKSVLVFGCKKQRFSY